MESEGIFTAGTATVAANGTVITFQNAGSLADLRPGDRFGGHVGLNQRILEVGPGNGLTAAQVRLAFPWKGPGQSVAPYEITYKPSSSGFRQSIKDLIDRYGEGILPVLATLPIAADTMFYGNGNDSVALTMLTEAARGLLGDDVVPRSGTGNAQHRNNQQNDARFMQPGAFGFGAAAIGLTAADDLNTLPVQTAVYRWGNSNRPANTPNNNTAMMINIAQQAGYGSQIVFASNGSYWIRYLGYAQSTNWMQIASQEVGSFSPIFQGLTTAGTPAYAANSGSYVRVGNLVFASIYLVVTDVGGAAGQIIIGGLPFARASGNQRRIQFSPGFWGGLTLPAGTIMMNGFMIDVSNQFRLYRSTLTSGSALVNVSDVTGNFTLYGNITYEVA